MSDEIDDSSAPLIEHLAELRTRLIHSAVAFIIAMVLCFTVAGRIFDFLAQPILELLRANGQSEDLIYTGLQQGFMVHIRISLFGGFVLAFPYIAYQLWRFVAPGLYRQEKNAFLPFLIASPVLFTLGAAFAFYIVLPLAYDFFLGFQQNSDGADLIDAVGITYLGTINEYLGLTMKFILAFGLCFQLPVLLTLMGKAGLVSAEGLGNMRKYAVVAILVLAAIVTPPDVITQIILFVVVYALYELSIQLVRMVERKREAELRAQGLYDEDEEEADAPDVAADGSK
ncbi:twin-arginine translocase subunit TatC [Oceanomicrobium pacificus]|uniref:Sec-independent protein translocase protein TatC n=1 Tax=Oceanomicrobium pacificus TaxID=2692916 RepID=A0A6B0TV32_9RHOB|nr:twin-arginine translocase subunit TatC [Oceanomicrobium pacificus]MXU65625.1 twin-arginine translocase subunit TatC [Oceanomicrobium pacificus]